ncbi:MAG: hypothetical protein JWM68_5793, partial [Verrucomicrobiales bacterium]|nr:hypothetical protein [Verrucomicrobiales bacterium]
MKTKQNLVGLRQSPGRFRALSTALLLCGLFLLSVASGWAKHIQFYNHSPDIIEAAIEFDSATINPGDSATLYVSEDGYSLVWGPVGTGYPYNTAGEVVYEDTKVSYFGFEDFPRFSQYHLNNGNWVLDYSNIWTIEFQNHSQDTVELGIEYDYAVVGPGETTTVSVSSGGYSLLWGPVGTGMPYNTAGEVTYETTKVLYFGFEDFPRFTQYHKVNGNWVIDYSNIWTIEFQNHSQDTVELGIEFDYATVGPGETTTVSVSSGGYSLLWGPVGTGMPYNTAGEVTYETTKV